MFTYNESGMYLKCGMIFFDSNNNGGLHMIGTLREGRWKGIGKIMTEKLMQEPKENNADYCVLHASIMGEPTYSELGFKSFGEIETYRVLK